MNTRAFRWAVVLFALFHVYNNWFTAVSELWFAAIHFGGFGALCAMSFHRPGAAALFSGWRNAVNILFALLALSIPAYYILFEDALYVRESEFIASDYIFSAMAVILAMEFTRRTTGWFMPMLIAVSLSYILFLGQYVPGVFSSTSGSIGQI